MWPGLQGRQVCFFLAGTQVQVALQEETRQFPRPVLRILLHLLMGQEQCIGKGEGGSELS